MSITLGPVAFEAISSLKNQSDWRNFVDALHDQVSVFMHRAVEVPQAERADATGYARGMRDILAYIEQVESPLPGNRVPKPVVRTQRELEQRAQSRV